VRAIGDVILEIDAELTALDVRHAFGGALALAHYAEPRGTVDVDVNVGVFCESKTTLLAELDKIGWDADDEAARAPPAAGTRLHQTGETVYVLESFYEAPRGQVADAIRSLIAFGSIVCVDPGLLLRAVEVYESDRLDFAEAYLVASAESTGVFRVASFDKAIDRVDTVERVEPSRT